jgi:hypothetical protein
MATHPWNSPSQASPLSRWLAAGFLSGALAVLLFHQGAFAVLHSFGLSERTPYPMQPTAPFGIPQVWSLTFWGGLWGMALAAALRRARGATLLLLAVVFGAILPTFVAWFVVAPLRGAPVATGNLGTALATGLIVNGAWGLGTGIGLLLFGTPWGRRERRYRPR